MYKKHNELTVIVEILITIFGHVILVSKVVDNRKCTSIQKINYLPSYQTVDITCIIFFLSFSEITMTQVIENILLICTKFLWRFFFNNMINTY